MGMSTLDTQRRQKGLPLSRVSPADIFESFHHHSKSATGAANAAGSASTNPSTANNGSDIGNGFASAAEGFGCFQVSKELKHDN